jgi:cytochrome c
MAQAVVAALLVSLLFITPAQADRGADCQMLVENAVAFIREKGLDYSIKVFSARKSPFIDGEMYIFAVSMDNVMLAHPYKPDLVGKNQGDTRDSKGKPVFVEFKQVAEKDGSGWVEYMSPKPGEKGDFIRRCFIKKVPGENAYVGAGFFE